MAEVLIGIGSNLGNREANIKSALDLIGEKCKILKISSVYETEPVGYRAQGMFLNCVVRAETKLEPEELLNFLQSIEKRFGRTRTIQDGPRTMDLDILSYGNMIIKKPNLDVPHPRMHERMFVLQPLEEICGDFVHPELKKRIYEMKKSIGSQNQFVKKHSSVNNKNRKIYIQRLS